MSDTTSTNSTDAAYPAESSIFPSSIEKEQPSQHTTTLQQCPVDHKSRQTVTSLSSMNSEKEGCGSETLINASNNMLLYPNQKPAKGQRIPLRTTRELSSIPRVLSETTNNRTEDGNESGSANVCNEEKVWIYPSEQMFFNAMRRKNWNPREEDMRVVIQMHNAVNEKAWKEILEWEKLHEK
jgi:cytochrome c heme-lyase